MATTSNKGTPKKHHPLSALSRKQWTMVVLGALIVLSAAISVSRVSVANADYICTRVIVEDGSCGNGSWSPWTVVETYTDDEDREVTVERRLYNGTRVLRHVIQYANRRTTCQDGYVRTNRGESGGESGFMSGNIRTESAICSLEERRVVVGDDISDDVVRTDLGDGAVTTDSRTLGSLGDATAFRRSLISALLDVHPNLVRTNDTTKITWTSIETTSCTVTGSNGDSWTGLSGEKTSSPITGETTYTLDCTAFDGSKVTETKKVNVAPGVIEI
jgi:hypothetical protein